MLNAQSNNSRFDLHNLWWLLLAGISIVLDQFTKYLAVKHIAHHDSFCEAGSRLICAFSESIPVLPVLNWTLAYNHGAAFSFLSDAGGWQRYFFTGLAGLVSIAFTVWLLRMPRQQVVLPLAIALVLGGAVGNLIDRVTLGYVVDFVHVFYQNHHFPVFNLADSSITLGTILLIIDTFFLEKYRIQKAAAQATTTHPE